LEKKPKKVYTPVERSWKQDGRTANE